MSPMFGYSLSSVVSLLLWLGVLEAEGRPTLNWFVPEGESMRVFGK